MAPDDVVSAIHFHELGKYLGKCGYRVEAWPCNRSRRQKRNFKSLENLSGVEYRRVFRLGVSQDRVLGRLSNTFWMLSSWLYRAMTGRLKDTRFVIIGTDPIFSVLIVPLLKLINKDLKILYWSFDLHPEASIAQGKFQENSVFIRVLKRMIALSLKKCDSIVHIGECMHERLKLYETSTQYKELVPWAISEPNEIVLDNSHLKRKYFGEAELVLFYSGNLGEAHDAQQLLDFARMFNEDPRVLFAFSVRGSKAELFKSNLSVEDRNIKLMEFCDRNELNDRLSAADIHIVSLNETWNGIAIPSKFFGSIATGRPVVFLGPETSAISKWINQYGLGWSVQRENIETAAKSINELDVDALNLLFKKCKNTYDQKFSKHTILNGWSELLNDINGSP